MFQYIQLIDKILLLSPVLFALGHLPGGGVRSPIRTCQDVGLLVWMEQKAPDYCLHASWAKQRVGRICDWKARQKCWRHAHDPFMRKHICYTNLFVTSQRFYVCPELRFDQRSSSVIWQRADLGWVSGPATGMFWKVGALSYFVNNR